jgi:hypothetical protein
MDMEIILRMGFGQDELARHAWPHTLALTGLQSAANEMDLIADS